MKRLVWVVLLAIAAPGLRAQTPPDTGGEPEVQRLQHELRQRWNARVRENLGLSNDQATRLQTTEDTYLRQRRDVAQRQRAINEALRGQLQPGVAANEDSVRKLMAARERNRASLTQLERDDRKSTRLNSSHITSSYAVFCLNKKKTRCPPSKFATSSPSGATPCSSSRSR